MNSGRFRFERFELDIGDRRLREDGTPVELNARYFDALALLVAEPGKLVSKDRFLAEVWSGVPVTDEALTQCIKTLRQALGDDAARPRFIETVPKHGYRFIARVAAPEPAETPDDSTGRSSWRRILLLGGAGTIGAGAAGVLGGLAYGFAAAAQPVAPGMGAASVLIVLTWLTIAAALMGGAGVSFGIAAANLARNPLWRIAGGAAGGLAVGGVVKLLGLDAFNLLLGRSPGDITGGVEGLLLGSAVGTGAWLAAGRGGSIRRRAASAGLIGAVAGVLIVALGCRMMGGSLASLAATFPDSRLQLDAVGRLFGEAGFGPLSQMVTGGIEGGLFGACIVGAMALAERGLGGGERSKMVAEEGLEPPTRGL